MSLFEGRASALFVILAGIGISLMTRSSVARNEKIKISNSRKIIWKRALFLFILGLLFIRNGVDWGYITLLWCLPFRCCLTHYSPKKALLFLSIIILLLAQSLQLTFNAFEGWEALLHL